jgi:hypothetical protein
VGEQGCLQLQLSGYVGGTVVFEQIKRDVGAIVDLELGQEAVNATRDPSVKERRIS